MTASQFCVFCYKASDSPKETTKVLHHSTKFVKLLSQFVNCRDTETDIFFSKIGTSDKFIKCCASCSTIIESFCEIYHNLKVLELQLDLKLNKLVGKIEHANKVPTRWISLNKILEKFFQNDLVKQTEVQNLIRSFRRNVVKADYQRKLTSQPRVILKKDDKVIQSTIERKEIEKDIVSEISEGEDNENEDNETLTSDNSLSKGLSANKVLTKRYENALIDLKKLRRDCKDKKCPICGHQLTSFRSLYTHMDGHKNVNVLKLQCKECGKKFYSNYYLARHLKHHSSNKPCVCRFCGYRYKFKHTLKLHLEEKHMDEQDIEQAINMSGNSQIESSKTIGNANVRKHNVSKENNKYVVREKRSTNVVYFRDDKNTDDDGNEPSIEVMPFPENGNITVHVENANGDPVTEYEPEEQEINYNSEYQSVDTEETSPTAIFKDPQIQIKMEHPAISVDSNSTSKNVSQSNNLSKTTMDKRRLTTSEEIRREIVNISLKKVNISRTKLSNRKTCTICGKRVKSSSALVQHMKCHQQRNNKLEEKRIVDRIQNKNVSTNFMPSSKNSAVDQHNFNDSSKLSPNQIDKDASKSTEPQQQRYSLREKRISKFANLEEIDSDHDDHSEKGLLCKNKYGKEAANVLDTKATTNKLTNDLTTNQSRMKSSSGRKTLILQCNVCTRKFTTFLKKDHHFKVSHDLEGSKYTGKIFQCKFDECSAYFLRKCQLKFHYKLEHINKKDVKSVKVDSPKNPFPCTSCSRRFAFRSRLIIHMEYHKSPKEWKWECGTCGKKSPSEYKLKEHIMRHTEGNPIKCRFCKMKFKCVTRLKEHCMKAHRNEEDVRTEIESKIKTPKFSGESSLAVDSIIKCEVCSREFKTVLWKDCHFKRHHDLSESAKGEITKCKKAGCSAYFLSIHQLRIHLFREHKVQSKQRFGRKGNVKEKRFVCSICGKGFKGRCPLNRHLEYHKDPREWKWECGLCGKKSAAEYKLKAHMRTHTNEKPFKCRFCGQRFRGDWKFKSHLRWEHGDEADVKAELEIKRVGMQRPNGSSKFSNLDKTDEETEDQTAKENADENYEEIEEKNHTEGNGNNEQNHLKADQSNILKRKGECFGDGALVEFEDLD